MDKQISDNSSNLMERYRNQTLKELQTADLTDGDVRFDNSTIRDTIILLLDHYDTEIEENCSSAMVMAPAGNTPSAFEERFRHIVETLRIEVLRKYTILSEQEHRESQSPNLPIQQIALPPGHLCLKILAFLYSTKTFDRMISPAVSDMRFEYFEAIANKQQWKAKWIQLRGILSLLGALLYHAWDSVFGKLFRSIFQVS